MDTLAELTARAALSPLAWLALRSPDTAERPYAEFHHALTRLPAPGEKQARVVFRSAAKTTLVEALIVWAIETRQVRGVLLVRANGTFCRQARDAIEDLAHRAGLPVDVRHQDGLVIVDDVPVWTKAPGMATRGIKYQNLSGEVIRPDLDVIDDLEDDDSAYSQTQTERLERYLTKVVIPTAGTGHPARVIMLGTPLSPTSLIAKAMRREPPFDVGWLPPMVQPYVDSEGVAAWPDTFDPDLEGSTADDVWATEYLLEPLPSGSLVFPPARTVWTPDGAMPRLGRCRIGVDPATGDGSDATGIVATGLAPGGLHTPAAWRWEGDGDEVPGKVVDMIDHLRTLGHMVDGVTVEAVGGFRFVARRTAELVYPIPCSHGKPKDSKLVRAQELTRWHKAGAVHLAESLRGGVLDVEAHTWNRRGLTVTGHDDMPDAWVWSARAATDGWSVQPPHPQAA